MIITVVITFYFFEYILIYIWLWKMLSPATSLCQKGVKDLTWVPILLPVPPPNLPSPPPSPKGFTQKCLNLANALLKGITLIYSTKYWGCKQMSLHFVSICSDSMLHRSGRPLRSFLNGHSLHRTAGHSLLLYRSVVPVMEFFSPIHNLFFAVITANHLNFPTDSSLGHSILHFC